MYKYTKNGKIVGVSNVKTAHSDPKIVETKITEEEYSAILKKEKNITNEKIELLEWFDGYYAQHEQKFRRLHTLNKLTDEGKNAYNALVELYNEAELKRRRIQEIEWLLQ